MVLFWLLASGFLATGGYSSTSEAAAPKYSQVQTPNLTSPQPGSMAGTLSKLSIGPADVARGSYGLPLPIDLPDSRGAALVNVFPTYSPESGISEWGMGWDVSLSIRRHRLVGTINYDADDDLMSPWGRLTEGTDGFLYPVGLSALVRVEEKDGGFEAVTQDGTRYLFPEDKAVITSRGAYAWVLSEVVNLVGEKTELEWEKNASNRPFLKAIRYGGRGPQRQVEVLFQYSPVAFPFEDHRAGSVMLLDRRVTGIVARARLNGTGDYQTLWSYSFGYESSPVGPAFYLTSVVKVHRSGQQVPPIRYAYNYGADSLTNAKLTLVPELDSYLSAYGDTGIQPDKVSMMDLEDDGAVDLENSYSQMQVRQKAGKWVMESLPPRTGTENPLCRPNPSIYNKPRILARMAADSSEPQVVHTRGSLAGTTQITICNRLGNELYAASLAGSFELGANTRLVDLNNDRRPDLVRIYGGGYQVLENTSTSPTSYSFAVRSSGALTPAVLPKATFGQDANGDGIVDLVGVYDNALTVWHGLGNLRFEQEGTTLPLRNSNGTPLTSVPGEVAFIDANRDGLVDVLVSSGRSILLFMNQGTQFILKDVPGLRGLAWDFTFPAIADMSGRTDNEVVLVRNKKAQAIALSLPGTGLMKTADDGKGTVLGFTHGRAMPSPGLGHRQTLLESLTVESTGYDTVTYTYNYESPTFHSTGKFLVGFDKVTKSSPHLMEQLSLLNNDVVSGVPAWTALSDDTSSFYRFTENQYEQDALFQGLPFFRRVSERQGLRSWDDFQEMATTTEYAYGDDERVLCPTETVTRGRNGTLTKVIELTEIPALDSQWHCLHEEETYLGETPVATASEASTFTHAAHIYRNDIGQVTSVVALGETDEMVLQDVRYDDEYRMFEVSQPGRGTATMTYSPDTGLLMSITSPDGMVKQILNRDGLSDAIAQLQIEHGPGGAFTSFYRFDGLERLQSAWDDMGLSSESLPNVVYQYRYASGNSPAKVETQTLVGMTAATPDQPAQQSHRTISVLGGADGETLGTATRIPEGWVLSGLVIRNRSLLETKAYRKASPVTDLPSTVEELFTGAVSLGQRRTSGLGETVLDKSVIQKDVEREVTGSSEILDGLLVSESIENGLHIRRAAADADGTVAWKEDEAGNRSSFLYDSMNRLVGVELPDGTVQRIRFDSYGRIQQVERTDVVTIRYEYHPRKGLLETKKIVESDGNIERIVSYGYDEIGRPLWERYSQPAQGTTSLVSFEHDGISVDSASTPGQLGFLTRISGEGYEKRFVYNRDGSVKSSSIDLANWWQIAREKSYYEDGSVRQDIWVVRDNNGVERQRVLMENIVDEFGRPSALELDGKGLAQLRYDAEGQVEQALFTNGETLGLRYDSVTGKPKGYSQSTADWSSDLGWTLNARGQVETESITIGDQAFNRRYGYDSRGFLEKAEDRDQRSEYRYGQTGLLTWIDDLKGERSVIRSGQEIDTGTELYEYDLQGRGIRKGDLQMAYGPNGHLSVARRGDREWNYLYDETGQRILKLNGSEPVAAFVDGAYLTAERNENAESCAGMDCYQPRLIIPVHFAGHLVGTLNNGAFEMLATDPRGSLIAENGTPNLGTPYGVRKQHPELSAALDYVEKGYDADLEMVRMGVRDYDPSIGQFLTPDPLFLEQIDKCASDPVQCGLYGYAGNDPIMFADPKGTDKEISFQGDGEVITAGPYKEISFRGDGEVITANPKNLMNERFGSHRKSDIQAGDVILNEMTNAAYREAKQWGSLPDNPLPLHPNPGAEVLHGVSEVTHKAAPKLASLAGLAAAAVTIYEVAYAAASGVCENIRANSGRSVGDGRLNFYSPFAAGVGTVLDPNFRPNIPKAGTMAHYAYKAGQDYAKSLSPVAQYQLGLSLLNHSGNVYDTRESYDRSWTGEFVQRQVYLSFHRTQFLTE
jgi:RHS repeat-associated protein